MVGAAGAVDERDPALGEALEGLDLVRLDLVLDVAGDHRATAARSNCVVSTV